MKNYVSFKAASVVADYKRRQRAKLKEFRKNCIYCMKRNTKECDIKKDDNNNFYCSKVNY